MLPAKEGLCAGGPLSWYQSHANLPGMSCPPRGQKANVKRLGVENDSLLLMLSPRGFTCSLYILYMSVCSKRTDPDLQHPLRWVSLVPLITTAWKQLYPEQEMVAF